MPRRFPTARALLVLIGLSAVTARAQEARFSFPLTHYQLKNGLNVVLSEDHSLPLVSVVLAYHTGAVRESYGKTGLAYFLENMMFMGSLNVGPMQHISYINKIGGEPNASTTEDVTYFYETVPSNQLGLALWLESDRMKALEIDGAKTERVRQALLDEIGQRQASEPYLESARAFDRMLYPDFARGHPVQGVERDIRTLTAEDVEDFYSAYFVPNNAVLVVVGNIDLPKTKAAIEKYFDSIPKGGDIPSLPPPPPPEKRQVTETVQEPLATAPAFHLGFPIAAPYSQDYYPMVILDYILLKGSSSRLYRKLIKKEFLAYYLSGGIDKRDGAAALKIFAMNNNDDMVALCQKAIFSELNKIRTSYVPADELQKAKNMFKRDYVSRLASPLDRAMFLAETFFSPVGLEKAPLELEKYLKITPLRLIGAASRYLSPENSILLDVKAR
jgi:zinc protease